MLHLVGPNTAGKAPSGFMSAQRAQYETSRLESMSRLYRGIYYDEEDREDLSAFVKKNAMRIANYIFPGAALSHASAVMKGAVEHEESTSDSPRYKLFLAGNYNHRVSLQYLEIIQSDGLKSGRIHQFCQNIADNQERIYGPMGLKCLPEEVVLLQQFGRRRYHPERFLNEPSLNRLLGQLKERHGDQLVNRLRNVANEIGDFSAELDASINYFRTWEKNSAKRLVERYAGTPTPKEGDVNNVLEFTMGWYRKPIGRIVNNGVAWNFTYDEHWVLPLSVGKTKPGVMPPFIHNLFPEGYLLDAMNEAMGSGSGLNANVLAQSERYLSNIAIVKNSDRLKQLPLDVLKGRLADFSDNLDVFGGHKVEMPSATAEFVGQLNKILTDIRMPRESGNQPKIPCYLDEDGNLVPAMDLPFTHIVKLAGLYKDPHHLRGVVEWASMSLARAGGVKTCDFALLEMDNGALAYVCERFDIPQSEDDMRMIYAEDFCSVHSKGPMFKMLADDGMESLIDAYHQHATPNRQDAEQLFRQIYANYVLENGDFHLKNASLIRVAEPNLEGFRSTRLSPAYDIMNTRYFADFAKGPDVRESMVLDFRGKATGFTLEDFQSIGATLKIDADRSEQLMWEVAHGIAKKATEIANNMPEILDKHPKAREVISDLLERAVMLAAKDFDDIPILKVAAKSDAPVDEVAQGDDPAEPEFMRDVRRSLARRP